jgi:C4-dicarboxylate-specific signal transduction histidine kinase
VFRKVISIFGVCLLLAVVALGCGGNEAAKMDTKVGVSALVALADSHISSYVNVLEALTMTQEVQSGNWEDMEGMLAKVEQDQVLNTIWFVLPDGSFYEVGRGRTDQNLSNRTYFPALMAGNNVLGDLVIGKTVNRKSLIAASPVIREGEVIGGLGAGIYLDDLSNTIDEELALPDDMVFYATTEAGQVALHSDTTLIFETNANLAKNVVYETSPLTGWRFALGYKENEQADRMDTKVGVSAVVSLADNHISSYSDVLEALVMTQEVQSGDWEEMVGLLAKIQRAQVPSTLWFVLPDGSYYTVDLGLTDQNLSNRTYFPGLMAGNNVLGDLVVSKSTGKKSFIVASPVIREGEVIGGLGASIFLDNLSNTIGEELALPDDMVFYATTAAGDVVLHSDTQLIFETSPHLAKNVVYETSPLTGWRFALGYKD